MRVSILVEAKATRYWSLDFVYDQLTRGRCFRVLNVVDDVTLELTTLIEHRSKSDIIVSGHSTEFASNAILVRSKDHYIDWRYIASEWAGVYKDFRPY